ncbi:hypothetical protein BTW15_01355 [Pseudomonas syringae pv. tomato]|uniref:DUF551 domain-containing protein n=1 Tax=Pseudomonas syringae pv. tomato TaxID=323 RepID=A0AB36L026_PSEUB|nr:hypothetical protein [Pseudomonas syringae group genomosp. 3]MBX6510491.1 hypothetical protein [Pseudomonas syringae pv. tomato]OPE62023.1 hypothetical protein BTW15_01355 [Pseudomonas syringae pv. tomato]TES74671.1 hypothetical protein E2N89_23690 [Pseudomonas syringae pv. tomato]
MSSSKAKAEFTAWYLAEMIEMFGKGIKGQADLNLAWSRDDGSFADPLLRLALMSWEASRAVLRTWQPMESCPKHVDVLFFNERNGVIPGRLTDADSFMTDKERDEWDGGEEAQYRIDAFGFGHWGVDRMDGSEAPTHWMPYPEVLEASQ